MSPSSSKIISFPSGLTSRFIHVPVRVSIGTVVLGPGGLLTSHFGFSSLGFSGVAGDCPMASTLHNTLAIKTRNRKGGCDMSFLLYERRHDSARMRSAVAIQLLRSFPS